MNPSHPDQDSRFVALLTEHQAALRLYVASLLPGDPSAADVAQEANAKIWEKRADFEMGTNFKAWIFSIARYEVLNFRKREARDARLVFSEELEETFAEELGASDGLEHRRDALKGCLAKLRPKDRELLLHRYSREGTLADYSEKTGQSIGGLKVTLHRLRNALLSCVQKQMAAREIKA